MVFDIFAQSDLTIAPLDSGTTLGAIAVLISLVVSGAGLYRSYRLDQRAAKKADIDTVIENYRLLLAEAKERERKLETALERQNTIINKLETVVDEQRVVIHRLEQENGQLRQELATYRAGAK